MGVDDVYIVGELNVMEMVQERKKRKPETVFGELKMNGVLERKLERLS